MKNQVENDEMNQERLAFFGKIIASLSHEIMNTVATGKELSGLLEDLSFVSRKNGVPIPLDRMESIAGKLIHQAERGEILIRRLNKFSHTVDDSVRIEDLKNLVSDMIDLCQRFALLRQVELKADLSGIGFTTAVNPFTFQQVIFIVVHSMITSCEKDEKVQVIFNVEEDLCKIPVSRISGGGRPALDEASSRILKYLLSELNAKMEQKDETIALIFTKGH